MSRLGPLLRRHDGELTDEIKLVPSGPGLPQVPARLVPEATANLICGYCSVGCNLEAHLRDGVAVNLSPTRSYPVNRGAACPKGWEALTPLASPDRGTIPLVRDGKGRLQPVSWDHAIGEVAGRLASVRHRHGPAAVAFLGTGQMPSEELALFGSLLKFGLGAVHGDGNTRQCMATAVAAYNGTFGFDAPPYTYADLEISDVLVFWGANPAIAHPVLWERVYRNPHDPEIVVVDPRRTETATAATLHLAPTPKSDLALAYGLAALLIGRGAVDRRFIDDHTNGFEDFARFVAAYTPEVVADASGLRPEDLDRLAEVVAGGERVSFWWTMGVNQSHEGVLLAQALIAIALMTGNVGRPGAGANSITGQCNAMGSRIFANTTTLLGGHDYTNPEHRAKVAGDLGIDPARVPDTKGMAYDQILEGIVRGEIRALWVAGTNPGHSWIHQSHLDDVLSRLDLLVVSDPYPDTETAVAADVVLPAAAWGEKEGTFINSERRVGVIRKVAKAPGQALADFHIYRLVAEACGVSDMFEAWSSPEAVFRILARLTRDRPCDMSGIESYAAISEAEGIQWPFPKGATAVVGEERRLFADGRFHHPDGKARFVYGESRPPAEAVSRRYPLTLLTGRGSAAQWHTETRTGRSPLLRSLAPPGPYVEISPADALALSIAPEETVMVASARGEVRARAWVTPSVDPGMVFMSMHFAETNELTHPSFDPTSRQPSYKHCAVLVRRLEGWERSVIGGHPRTPGHREGTVKRRKHSGNGATTPVP